MGESPNLYYVDDGSGEEGVYLTATTLRDALTKYKNIVANFVNEDYKADGVATICTSSEVEDPESISLIAYAHQLYL